MKYPLHDAICHEDLDAVSKALVDLNDPEELILDRASLWHNKRPLDLAAEMNASGKQMIVTKLLVKFGVCDEGNTHPNWERPFITAQQNNKWAFLDTVKDTGAYQRFIVEERMRKEGLLWDSCKSGQNVNVKLLLDQGVDPNAEVPVKSGRKSIRSTPLETSCNHLNVETFDLLVGRGAKLPVDPKRRVEMMRFPARFGKVELLERLDRMGATQQLGKPKNNGNLPLWEALYGGQAETMDWLLAHGADPNGVSKHGKTKTVPLDAVLASGQMNIEQKIALGERLVGAGAKPDLTGTRWKYEYGERDEFLAAMKRKALASSVVHVERASDLADPEEVRARRTRGRAM